jgi:dephospho-CoA kinase
MTPSTTPKLIIGLVGEALSGKDTIAAYLAEKYGAVNMRYSNILDDILTILDQPLSRENESELALSLRVLFGNGVLAPALKKRAMNSGAPIVVLNGIRMQDEIADVKSYGATVVYVTAPEEIRYQRFLQRREKADDGRQTLAEFRIKQLKATETSVPSVGTQADYHINNIGSLETLHQAVDEIIAHMRGQTA